MSISKTTRNALKKITATPPSPFKSTLIKKKNKGKAENLKATYLLPGSQVVVSFQKRTSKNTKNNRLLQ